MGCAELCAALCVTCVQRCACSDVRAVCSCRGCIGRRAGVRDLRVCVCALGWSVRCAVRGLLACTVLGGTRHDADMPLCRVGLAASCVSARVCAWRDGSGERVAGRHVRGCALEACDNVKNRGCVIRAMCSPRLLACIADWGCCTAVLRLQICVVACALLHRVSLWLLCDCAALRAVDCSCLCVPLRCVHACVTTALHWESGVVLPACCRCCGCGR